MLENYDFVRAKKEELGHEQISPPRLITGKDLIDAGYEPGPRFGEVLQLVEDAQLEGVVRTREEALAFAHELLKKVPGNTE
jgi:poly(A) polymerase